MKQNLLHSHVMYFEKMLSTDNNNIFLFIHDVHDVTRCDILSGMYSMKCVQYA